jgi:pilus assembly protein CpaC
MNEVELVIMVTPELVEPMDPSDVPPCLPGMSSRSPSDCDFYWKGYGEVPSCGPCAAGDCLWGGQGPSMGVGVGAENVPAPAPNNGKPAQPGANGGSSSTAPRSRSGSTNLSYPQSMAAGPGNQTNRTKPQNSRSTPPASKQSGEPSLIGPVGYDVVK